MSLVFPGLYAIMDASLIKTSEMAFAEMLAECGVELVQIRNKKASSRDLHQISARLSTFFKRQGVRLIVNDRPDLALLADAGGVHVGQNDVDVEVAREVCGSDRWVGISTHSLEQVRRANATSADYIAIGPIFPTSTKEDLEPVLGVECIRAARRLTSKPLVAIGGMTLDRVPEVFQAGADCIALARGLICVTDPRRRTQEFVQVTSESRRETL